jgi:YVTN family beta-propeller protein
MSFRRVGGLAAMALSILLCMACGDVYRPVVIPISTTPPNPSSFHAVFAVSNNVAFNPGSALQIDVSGDSNIGVANMGVNPTHAAILPNNSRVFVASAGSMFAGGADVVTAFTPAVGGSIASGLGTLTTFSLPNVIPSQSTSITAISESGNAVTVTLSAPLIKAAVGGTIEISSVPVAGYNGSFTITAVSGTTIQYNDSATGLASASVGTAGISIPLTCSYLPDFLTTTQQAAVFLANYGVEGDPNCNLSSTDSVAIVSPSLGTVSNITYLPAGAHPVALVETPDAQNLYVLNEGNNTVTDLSPVDLAPLTATPIAVPNTPVWAVARVDSKKVYVVTQGDGQLHTIDTATNSLTSSVPVGGPGANFVLYDKSRNRLYVTNPTAGTVYVFDATADPPSLLGAISMNAGTSAPCPNGCSPVSVTALPDGSRFYVASYETAAACPDTNIGSASPCIIPRLTVFNAASLTVKPISSSLSLLPPSISLLARPQFDGTQYAVVPASSCAPPAIYTPGTTRFRMFTTASADSSHVYVSICDGGVIADINATTSSIATGSNNTPDMLMTDLPTPFGAGPVGSNSQPATQNPIFLLTGQ